MKKDDRKPRFFSVDNVSPSAEDGINEDEWAAWLPSGIAPDGAEGNIMYKTERTNTICEHNWNGYSSEEYHRVASRDAIEEKVAEVVTAIRCAVGGEVEANIVRDDDVFVVRIEMNYALSVKRGSRDYVIFAPHAVEGEDEYEDGERYRWIEF